MELVRAGQIKPSDTTDDVLTTLPEGKAGWAKPARLTVQDENGTIATDVKQFDFQGPGVQAQVGEDGEVIVTVDSFATSLVPLTTVLDGVPQLVWESDDSLALTEVPR